MNIAIVYDKHGNEWSYTPPDSYEIEIIYREDGSLQAYARSKTGQPMTLGEWSSGSWSHALIQGEVVEGADK